MTTNQLGRLLAGAAAVSVMAASGVAFAQAAAAPAAPAPLQSGPAIAGVCYFSQERAVGTSAAGKYMVDRIKQLGAAVNAELTAEGTSLDTDVKAFNAQAASLTPDARNTRGQALQQRAEAFERKRAVRQQELELTLRKAQGRILTDINPLARAAYVQRNCSILLDGNSVMVGNPQMDLTDGVVAQLNTKLTTFPIERERIEQQAAAGARPAAAAPAPAKPPVKKN